MGKIAVVTDSNSGITQKKGEELGISVIPMPFFIRRRTVSGGHYSYTGRIL